MSKLFQKLALIQSQLRSIPETGFNSFHKYSYATAEDIINAVRPICSQHGIFISVTCTSHQILKDGRAASVIVTLTATDVETGEATTCSMPGYAEDSKSDKSLWKAVTGASKYCIRSFFCLATCDDPENEETSERSPSGAPAANSNGNGKQSKNTQRSAQSEAPPIPPAGNGTAPPTLLEQTTQQMQRVGWTTEEGKEFLQITYACRSRKHLSEHQLRDFLEHLRSLPAPGARAPALV